MKHILLALLLFGLIPLAYSQGAWTKKKDFTGPPKYLNVGFSIGSKGYIGTGRDDASGTNFSNNFWEWDPLTDVWTQKANFPGLGRAQALGFSIVNKGYIGLGFGNGGILGGVGIYYPDFWEWDQANNNWTKRADFPGLGREGVVGFSIGTKGYFGTGLYGSLFNDFWEWDQGSDTWIRKADFPGEKRVHAVGFSIGTKGYIGTGGDGNFNIEYNDFWEWDQLSDLWVRKADFPGIKREIAVGFVIGTCGFIGTGYEKGGNQFGNLVNHSDFWAWDQGGDSWTRQADFGAGGDGGGIAFSIGNSAYCGYGGFTNCLWEFNGSACSSPNISATISKSDILCHGKCLGTCTVTPSGGSPQYSYSWNSDPIQTTQIATGLCAGSYSVEIMDAHFIRTQATVTINEPLKINLNTFITDTICPGENEILNSLADGGTPPYIYNWDNGVFIGPTYTVSPITNTSYSVIVTDNYGCTDTAKAIVVVKSLPTISATPDNTIFLGDSIPLNIVTIGISPFSYQWMPIEGLDMSNQPTVIAHPTISTKYFILVSDKNACQSIDSITITVLPNCAEPFVPNAFSPNGDFRNDTLKVRGDYCIEDFNFTIYNRWGEKIFETQDIQKGWDGNISLPSARERKEANTGVYFYVVNLTSSNNSAPITKKGNVSLIR